MSSLAQKIEEYKVGFREKVPKDIQEKMLLATQKLKMKNISQNSLKTGDRLPNFSLKDGEGKEIDFGIFLKNNDFVIINFYRGSWCPYCSLELRELQTVFSDLQSLNTTIVAISPQTLENSTTTKEDACLEFEVLSDIDNVAAKQFGLVFSLDESLKGIYKQFGIDIPQANNSQSYEIPVPATYIVSKNANIVYHFVDEDYTKRADPLVLVEKVKALMLI